MTRRATREITLLAWTTRHPRMVLAVMALCVAAASASLPKLEKDTDTYAYMSVDHPSRVANRRLEEIFGASGDLTVMVAVIDPAPGGVFRPERLALVDWLTRRIEEIPGIDPDRVDSLATVKDVVDTEAGLEVARFFETPPETPEAAQKIRDAVMDFEMYVGSLVTRDGRATAIFAELLAEEHGEAVYARLLELVEQAPAEGAEIHVAGLGAYQALIGDYIDADLRRLNPIVGVVLVSMLFLAYRTLPGLLLPVLSAAGGLGVALGTMAAAGIPIYGVTSSMSVILIAIGVCDGIHIMGQYYEEAAISPRATGRELTIRTLSALWRPLTLTSVTTSAGFLALAASAEIPPMRWYGVFASIGVFAALLLSLFALPALLVLLRPHHSSAYAARSKGSRGAAPRVDRFGRATVAFGRIVDERALVVLAVGAGIAAVGIAGALRVERNNEYHQYLNPSEPLYQAEEAINATLGGIQGLNVIVDTGDADGLYDPEILRRVDALQRFLEDIPHVASTTSIVDVVKQMQREANGGDPARYAIPDTPDGIAQYLLLYSLGTDPAEIGRLVDTERRLVNVRAAFDRSRWSDARVAVEATRRYLDSERKESGLDTSLAGLIPFGQAVDRLVARGQALGVPLAFLVVWLVLAASYRSWVAGLLAILPVGFAMLLAYATMGYCGIWLNFATSMTGAIAVGVSVDFAVHAIDRLTELIRERGLPREQAFESFFSSTGRALLFNCAAVMLGFGVLMFGSVPSVGEFGILVAVCVTASFLASMTLLPALIRVLQPAFLVRRAGPEEAGVDGGRGAIRARVRNRA